MARLDQTKQVVEKLSSQWRGGTPVTVVASAQDLPVEAPPDVRGMYQNAATWIVADTQPAWQVAQTMAHEMLGHHSMRRTLGTKWRPFMHAIQAGIRSGDTRLGLAREMVRSAYVDEAGVFNLSALSESDEIAALAAETGFDVTAGRMAIKQPVRKMALATAGQFAREGLYADVPATFEQLEGMLLTAEHRLRHGGSFWGLGQKLRDWYALLMTKPQNPYQPPMSMRESEFLLREHADQQKAKNDNAGMRLGFQLLVAAVLLVIGAVAFVWNVGYFLGYFR